MKANARASSGFFTPARTRCAIWAISSFHPVQPDLAVKPAILFPARVHLHVQEEMHLPPERLGQLLSRSLADLLDAGAALAEDDRLLGVAGDEDLLVDGDRAVLSLLIFLRLD